jgi:4'-phosphopantetheinyl transferase
VRSAGGAAGEIRVWLAPPEAATHFDPGRQSAADAARWATLQVPSRRLEWAASRALLAHLAGQGLTSASLAHSGGWCAALTAPTALRAGIDLERIRARDELALARWAYAESEWQALAALQAAERQRRFYALWTLKEACAKALGLGLLVALRECVFRVDGGRWQGRVPTRDPWQAWVFAPRSELVLAVACTGERARLAAIPHLLEWPHRRAVEWAPVAHVRSED